MPLKRCGSVSARFSVWFSRRRRAGERRRVDRHHVDAAGIERVQRGLARDDVQRRAPLAAGFGEIERAVVELERRERVARLPCVAPASRQCRRPAIIRCRTRKRSPSSPMTMRLPSRRRLVHAPAGRVRDRRHGGAQQERVLQAHAVQDAAFDARLETLAIDLDVGQLWHISGGSRDRCARACVSAARRSRRCAAACRQDPRTRDTRRRARAPRTHSRPIEVRCRARVPAARRACPRRCRRRRSMSRSARRALSPPRGRDRDRASRSVTWSRVTIGTRSKSTPSVSSTGRAVSMRPLVAIAHGMRASVRCARSSRAPGSGRIAPDRRLYASACMRRSRSTASRHRSRWPVSRRSMFVNSPPLMPILRWMRQTDSGMPSLSSASLPGEHVLVDAVDERAVEVEEECGLGCVHSANGSSICIPYLSTLPP